MNAPRQAQLTKTSPLPEQCQDLPLVLWRNIFVVVDDGLLQLDDINCIAQCVKRLGEQYPGGVGGVTIVPANGKPPSETHRLAIKRAYYMVSKDLKAMCWMVDGQGFRAATLRASLAGLRLLLQPRFPTKIAASLDEALPWLCMQLGSASNTDWSEGVATVRETLNKVVVSRASLSPR